MTITWHLQISYNGKDFFGWQENEEVRTVQGEIAVRLRQLFNNNEMKIYGTSRTDAGVHAMDQHVSFTTPADTKITVDSLSYILYRWLPEDITIDSIIQEKKKFNARHSAKGKSYTYMLYHNFPRPNALLVDRLWRIPTELNVEAMRKAAKLLIGTHDFTSFANQGRHSKTPNPVKTIWDVQVVEKGQYLFISVTGNSFLYKMVRNIVGFLVSVGRENVKPEQTLDFINQKNRLIIESTAPAQGLYLAKVFFNDNEWKDFEPILPPYIV